MQAEKYISNDPNEIIALKMPAHREIFLSKIMLIILFVAFFKDFESNKNEPIVWIFAISFVAIFLVISSITSKKIQFIINKKGFWTKKHNFISWEDVWYYSIKEQDFTRSGHNSFYELQFKLKEKQIVITIKFENINCKIEDIQRSLSIYTKSFNIHDLGYEKERHW